MYKSFEEMPVWQLGDRFVQAVYNVTQTLPSSEDYALSGQSRRAALSICTNMAEGFGRSSNKDKNLFYICARGSAYEVKSLMFTGVSVKYWKMKNK